MLGIHDCRFLGAEPKKLGVEHFHVRQFGGARHVVLTADALWRLAGLNQFIGADVSDQFHAAAQICPELARITCARNAQRHTDDCDIVLSHVLTAIQHDVSLNLPNRD